MSTETNIPDHVPPELAKTTRLTMGEYIDENPWETVVLEECQGPNASYVTNIYPGGAPGWLFRRAEDLRAVYMDTDHFSSKGFSPFARLIGESWNQVPTELDPPEHTRFRQLLNPIFSPPAMAKMEDAVRKSARRCINTFKQEGGCEFMSEFALPYPVRVVLDLLDLPQERMDEFLEWERMLLHSSDLDVIAQGSRKVVDFLRGVIVERKKNPGDDLISFAIKSEVDGRKMTDDELLGYCFNLYIGGLDTVSASIGNHFRHLATYPEDQHWLRGDPERATPAVEELMRAYSPVTTFRTCIKETEIAGVTVKPDDKVAMCTTLANRDEKAFEQPHEVRLERGARHVAFGTGAHFCLGVHLAKRELRVALQEFLAAIPEFRIKPGARIKSQAGGIIQPTTLPLEW